MQRVEVRHIEGAVTAAKVPMHIDVACCEIGLPNGIVIVCQIVGSEQVCRYARPGRSRIVGAPGDRKGTYSVLNNVARNPQPERTDIIRPIVRRLAKIELSEPTTPFQKLAIVAKGVSARGEAEDRSRTLMEVCGFGEFRWIACRAVKNVYGALICLPNKEVPEIPEERIVALSYRNECHLDPARALLSVVDEERHLGAGEVLIVVETRHELERREVAQRA